MKTKWLRANLLMDEEEGVVAALSQTKSQRVDGRGSVRVRARAPATMLRVELHP